MEPDSWPILRDAVLRTAPQDEVYGFVNKQETLILRSRAKPCVSKDGPGSAIPFDKIPL